MRQQELLFKKHLRMFKDLFCSLNLILIEWNCPQTRFLFAFEVTKSRPMKFLNAIIFSLAIIIASYLLSNAYISRANPDGTIAPLDWEVPILYLI